jgi:uncharacterized protein YeaO (DUF488 family)
MAVRIVRLGTDRQAGEGLRIGTVRRPPRGVPKAEFASGNWYDVWYPNLAPSAETVQLAWQPAPTRSGRPSRASTAPRWRLPDASRTLDLLAALSHTANFSVGCYCENEARCHRSLLRGLLADRGAQVSG